MAMIASRNRTLWSGMGDLMTEPNDRDSAADTEETEMVGRREAVMRFAKYTAPIMVAALISTSGSQKGMAQCAVSCASG